MNTSLYIAFVVAVAALIFLPGPTMMLIASTSLRRGVRAGLVTVAGCTLAAAIQLSVVVAGLASVAMFVSSWFEWIRWVGVAYLAYLGARAWLESTRDHAYHADDLPATPGYRDFTEGLVVTLTNPKTLLFHGAFLPQFVDPALPVSFQLLVLAGSFLVIAAILDACWALLAARVGESLKASASQRWIDRISGSVLIAGAAVLALVRQTG